MERLTGVERLTGIKPTLGCSGKVEQSSLFRGL